MSKIDLKGRVAIVTGGAQGIGKSIALALADVGADVLLADVQEEALEKTAAELTAKGVKATTSLTDVSKSSDAEAMAKKAMEELGGLDILVNNAGITRDNLFLRMSEQEWDLVMNVNLKGAFNCCKAALKGLLKSEHGRIVNISSIIGLMGNAGQANYSASKAGLLGLTKSVAKEVGKRQITVNAIAPGFIKTAMTDALPEKIVEEYKKLIPLNDLGLPEDVADLVVFLASDMARYISGQVIQVDGGMLT